MTLKVVVRFRLVRRLRVVRFWLLLVRQHGLVTRLLVGSLLQLVELKSRFHMPMARLQVSRCLRSGQPIR